MEIAPASRQKEEESFDEDEALGFVGLVRSLTTYLRPEDIGPVIAAYRFAKEAHGRQIRKSGEPYITHPVAVATILAELRLDVPAMCAALLHDVVEDTPVTHRDIVNRFGDAVADLVDGVSKLDRIEFQTKAEAQGENFRKMLLAMAKDVRVILIKLADRLHNMRTMQAMVPEKRRSIARETMEIYAPIANRLGLDIIYRELDDLSFRYLYPNRYQVLEKALKTARGDQQEPVARTCEAIREKLASCGIRAIVSGREKNIFSLYKKMQGKNTRFSEIHDVYGFRVLVEDTPSCYMAMGALHQLYKPIPGRFKDYIAIPKGNGYQSLHTTLVGPTGQNIEVQIRTQEMHKVADAGVAAHWLYKARGTEVNDVQKKAHQWLQQLLEIQSESGDAVEFLETLKVDLFPDEVYVFTPKGKILSLPKGATCVDFAYAVHTGIGNRCVAAKINHELVPLRTELSSGDRVEIITAVHAHPNPAWINFVVTAKARSHIRHYLKTMQYQESVVLGERLLNQALRALQLDPAVINDGHWERFLRDNSGASRDEVLADIGLGKRLNVVVATKLGAVVDNGASDRKAVAQGSVFISGSEGMAVRLASCCSPIPGDAIVGYINKGKGLLIHTHDCPAIGDFRGDPDKWLDVQWDNQPNRLFPVTICVEVANQKGALAKIAAAIASVGTNIAHVNMSDEDGGTYTRLYFTLQVENRPHLARVMRRLRGISQVVRITRIKGSRKIERSPSS